jgi:hypothetical protein
VLPPPAAEFMGRQSAWRNLNEKRNQIFLHSENVKLLNHNKGVKKIAFISFFTISVGNVRCIY